VHHERQHAIAQLLSTTGSAHGDYEATALGGAYDEQWPAWYAQYLVEHGLNDLLGRAAPLSVADVSLALREADAAFKADHAAMAPMAWPSYYAERFLTLPDMSVTKTTLV
jgi:hypothetical protein